MPIYKDFQVTERAVVQIPVVPEFRGFSTTFAAGRAKRLEGRIKLVDDISRITKRYLLHNALLTKTLSPSDQGNVAAGIKAELENAANWWTVQGAPITLSDVIITVRSVRPLGGVLVVEVENPDRGNLDIQVLYAERSVGIQVTDTLIIPFGAYGGLN